MSISIHPELETKLRARARAEGLSVEAYLEHLLRAEPSAEDELTTLALDGVHSGDPDRSWPWILGSQASRVR
jgi:plasmid stability protein